MNTKEEMAGKPKYTYVKKGIYWFFRYKSLTAPLPGTPGDPAFVEKYERLLVQALRIDPPAIVHTRNTFAFVIDKFFADFEFKVLSASTQKNYRSHASNILPFLGDIDMMAATTEMIGDMRNAVNPGSADNLKRFISRLYGFAGSRGYVEAGINRAKGLKSIRPKSKGYVPWSDDEIGLLLEHAEGEILTLLIISLCTGQRPGDCEMMEWSQVLVDRVKVIQQKTRNEIDIPIHPLLREELERLRANGPVTGRIVRNDKGKPIGGKGFGYRLTKLIATIPNMPHRTPHGARFATAGILEDAGCTVEEMQSILGHTTYDQASVYLRRRKAADRAMGKMMTRAIRQGARRRGAVLSAKWTRPKRK